MKCISLLPTYGQIISFKCSFGSFTLRYSLYSFYLIRSISTAVTGAINPKDAPKAASKVATKVMAKASGKVSSLKTKAGRK